MVDVEFRVVSDRREGLLLALGQAIIANGFTLLRQRMTTAQEGVVLTMLVRGPQASLLPLEECLGTHPLVRSFEASQPGAPTAAVEAPPEVPGPSSPTRTNTLPTVADSRRIEALLPQLARDYPNIFIPLLALERELDAEQREPALRYIGQRVGAWVYKRDFALGGHLTLADAIRHIGLPALRQLVQAEMHEDHLHVRNSPFPHRGQHGACCHFLRGMLGGLLGGPHGTEGLHVIERQCRNTGAEICSFEFSA
ncbi:hypothetical protein [Lysobacter sp.]|uniref:hypothetical protein n=1 Tax=Lysobacter sp. TaxID=72226 RepID=UPI002D55091C|nr:hypothetical protein [Lysobacter sp.]HZX77612.1 hypothetical protein [Lysobacter sp.]